MALHHTALTIGVALALTTLASGQTHYVEDFEDMGFVPIGGWGPQGLLDRGWTFQNNSDPLGTIGYVPGCCWGGLINPLSGEGYLASYGDASAGFSPQFSNWAILPVVPDQQAGDLFGFYTISSDTSPWDNVALQVRYSPTGGTDVGAGVNDVGDFTTVLLDIETMPNYNSGPIDGWTYWELELPGPGRIALRQYGDSSLYFGIEDITIEHPVPPTPPADVNADGVVDVEDLVFVLLRWGVCPGSPCPADTNGDGVVDVIDMVAVILAWGA